jgi:hypothetical protein
MFSTMKERRDMPADCTPHPETVRCSEALVHAARAAVLGAVAAKFPSEPLFDPALSRVLSTCSSVVKRHGRLLEVALIEVLAESGAEVWQGVKIPYTRADFAFVASPDYALNRNRLLSHDKDDVAGWFDADVLAVDESAGWAAALQVRRGGGATEPGKRKRAEREIRALNLSLAAWLRQQGFARIETATAVAVDWLGQAGFSEDVVVHGEELDQFLGVPATAKIAAMSDVLRHELDRQMNELLRPMAAAFDRNRDLRDAGADRADPDVEEGRGALRFRPRRRQDAQFEGPAAKGSEPHVANVSSFRRARPSDRQIGL